MEEDRQNYSVVTPTDLPSATHNMQAIGTHLLLYHIAQWRMSRVGGATYTWPACSESHHNMEYVVVVVRSKEKWSSLSITKRDAGELRSSLLGVDSPTIWNHGEVLTQVATEGHVWIHGSTVVRVGVDVHESYCY